MEQNSKFDDVPPPSYEPPKGTYGSNAPVQGGYAYPPQPGPQQPQLAQHTILLQQPPTLVVGRAVLPLTEFPMTIVCPHCQATVTTMTSYETGTFTWVAAGIMCFFGLWLGCCLIPFCVDSAKDVEHRCPNCRNFVGKYCRYIN
ncbi:hypothetical protein BsWGS_19128 [Bradybaena similaris]